jgi:polyferredoxin
MSMEILGNTLQWVVAGGLVLAGVLAILLSIKNQTRKVTYLRFFIQIAMLVGIYISFTMALWLGILMLLIFGLTVVSGRFFCGWVCPFGFYMDLFTQARKALKIKYITLPERLNEALNKLRYIILAAIIAWCIYLIAIGGQPLQAFFFFLRGPFRPLNILVDPLEPLLLPFGSFLGLNGYSLSYPYMRDINFYTGEPFIASIIVYVFIGLTVASSFMVRRFWCRFCPTGISIAILNKYKGLKWMPLLKVNKDETKCTKCGICKRVCPMQVTEIYEEKGGNLAPSTCIQCFRCVEMCPYADTLKVKFAGKTVFKSRNWLEPSKIE